MQLNYIAIANDRVLNVEFYTHRNLKGRGEGVGVEHFTYILMGVFQEDRSFGGNKCCDILILRGNMC